MRVKYFSVYDKKTQTFGQLFPAATIGAAERSFSESINNQPDSMAAKYPDDFALYLHCEFDDESGSIVERHDPPQLVVDAFILVKER